MAKKYIISEENASEIRAYRKGVTDKYLDRRLYAVQLITLFGVRTRNTIIHLNASVDTIPVL